MLSIEWGFDGLQNCLDWRSTTVFEESWSALIGNEFIANATSFITLQIQMNYISTSLHNRTSLQQITKCCPFWNTKNVRISSLSTTQTKHNKILFFHLTQVFSLETISFLKHWILFEMRLLKLLRVNNIFVIWCSDSCQFDAFVRCRCCDGISRTFFVRRSTRMSFEFSLLGFTSFITETI
jgi:hypothetical protein